MIPVVPYLVAGHDVKVIASFVEVHVLSNRGMLVHNDIIILQGIVLVLYHNLRKETLLVNKQNIYDVLKYCL